MNKCNTLQEQVLENTKDIEIIKNRPKANVDAYDLSLILRGTEDINVDISDDNEWLEVRLDSIYKKGVNDKLTSLQSQVDNIDVDIYKPVSLATGTDLLSYNWDAYNNGTYFKGTDLIGVPDGVNGECIIRLIKSRNTRFAIELYNTGLYEGNTGTYINYHYSDKFEGWQKIQTNLSNDFVKKFVRIYDRYNSDISYGKENGLNINENITSEIFAKNLKKYNIIFLNTQYGLLLSTKNDFGGGVFGFSMTFSLIEGTGTNNTKLYSANCVLEGNKFTNIGGALWRVDTNGQSSSQLKISELKINEIFGGDLL